MSNKIILIGGGGHCKSCIDVIEQEGKYRIAGVIDKKDKIGETIINYKIIGEDNDLPKLIKKYKNFIITLGHISSPINRMRLFAAVKDLGGRFPIIISPYSYVSDHSCIKEGTIVMHNSIINAGSVVGTNCIINTKAIVEHDAIIGDHCHISTTSVVNGKVELGEGTFYGSGAISKNGIKIAPYSIIGAGAVVINDIVESGTYVGNPIKRIL
jgi:sugar O-acyltransferase (sialic acid O-acetyltransferase NeuD family)